MLGRYRSVQKRRCIREYCLVRLKSNGFPIGGADQDVERQATVRPPAADFREPRLGRFGVCHPSANSAAENRLMSARFDEPTAAGVPGCLLSCRGRSSAPGARSSELRAPPPSDGAALALGGVAPAPASVSRATSVSPRCHGFASCAEAALPV